VLNVQARDLFLRCQLLRAEAIEEREAFGVGRARELRELVLLGLPKAKLYRSTDDYDEEEAEPVRDHPTYLVVQGEDEVIPQNLVRRRSAIDEDMRLVHHGLLVLA
jgi:hypothetical protein